MESMQESLGTTSLTYVQCMFLIQRDAFNSTFFTEFNTYPLPFAQIKMQNFTRLCQTKSIVTVNGRFPGPRIIAREGDRVVIKVVNHVQYNVSLHWYCYITTPDEPICCDCWHFLNI